MLGAAAADSGTTFVGGDREYGEASEGVSAVAAFFAPVTKDGSVSTMLGLSGDVAVESAPMEYASAGGVAAGVVFARDEGWVGAARAE